MGVRLNWQNNSLGDSNVVYRSSTPMSPESLPEPLVSLTAETSSYDDLTAVDGETYYYRVALVRGATRALSGEVVIEVEPPIINGWFDAIMSVHPVGYWRMGETSGTVAFDSSGNDLDGVYLGARQPSSSLIPSDPTDGAMGCNGAGYADLPLSGPISVSGKTLLMAINMESIATTSCLWHLGSYGAARPWGLAAYVVGGQLALEWEESGFKYIYITEFTVSVGVSYRLAFRFETNRTVSLFVNGSLVSTKATEYDMGSAAGASIRVGAVNNNGNASSIFKGVVDEVAVIPSVLTNAKIREIDDAAV